MGLAIKIMGYFLGIIFVFFGILWIASTMTISVIVVGSIGLSMVILGIGIMYLGHRSGRKNKQYYFPSKQDNETETPTIEKKNETPLTEDQKETNIVENKTETSVVKRIMLYLFPSFSIIFVVYLLIDIYNHYPPKLIGISPP